MSDRKPVVVVTGVSRGIGLTMTRILLEELNANVIGLSRSQPSALGEIIEAHSSSVFFGSCDVADEAAVKIAIDEGLKKFGAIDGVILNAGVITGLGRLETADLNLWKQAFAVNTFSIVNVLKYTIPALRKSQLGGRVVFLSTGAAVGGMPGLGSYSASKAAMNSICRTLAKEEPDILSVAIAPGMVDTDMIAEVQAQGSDILDKEDYHKFKNGAAEGIFVDGRVSGHVIAAAALRGNKELSGQYLRWNDEKLSNCARQ